MNQHEKNKLQRKLIVATIAACFGAAQANPVSPQVVAGQATFSQQGNVFSITNTPNTIINWHSFSVGQNEITRFIQQNADSKVLNRITGQDPSKILGSLQSNGKVFLINPNGVIFGKDSRVDVNGLVASSLSLSNADFLAGRNNFKADGAAGKVENQGRITTPQGGQVFLIAPNVENNGIINAPNGDIVLAAGRSVQLVDSSNPSVQVVVSAPEDQALNLGQVVAQGGRIGIYGALVNQRGSVNADSAVMGENGRILLKASGRTTLDADSVTSARGAGKGGDIQILGKQVVLTDNARVDASGQQGGGAVLIGGDYQGRNAAVQNASQTYVGEHVVVSADALDNGDGGRIIVWGDDAAAVYGSVNARGGAKGGNGGFIETSAHSLDISAIHVDAGAAQGKNGTWLIDPYDIEVNATGIATLLDLLGFLSLPGLPTKVSASLINNATADVKLQAWHDLSINSAISMVNSGAGVVAEAGNNINVNAGITTKGGQISLTANTGGGASGTGAVNVKAGLNAATGNVSLNGKTVNFGAVTVSGNNIALSADGIKLVSGTTGNVQLQAKRDLDLNGALAFTNTGAGLVAKAGNNINVNDTVTTADGQIALTANDSSLGASGTGTLNVNAALNARAGNVALNGRTVSFADAPVSGNNIAITATSVKLASGASEDLQLNAANDITLAGAVSISNSGLGLDAQAGNNINVNSAVTTNGGRIALTASETGAVSVKAALNAGSGDIAVNGKTASFSGAAVKGYDVAVNAGTISVDSSSSLTSTGNMLSLVADKVTLGGKLTGAYEVAVLTNDAVSGSNDITADTLYVSGTSVNLSKANVNNVAVKATGDVTLTSSKDLNLASTGEAAGSLGVDFHGISSPGKVTLSAKSFSQEDDAPIMAKDLVLNVTSAGSIDLRSYDNHVSTLSADKVGSFHYQDSGAMTVKSVTMDSKAGDAGIWIDAGDLAVNTVDGRSSSVNLSGNSLTLANNASVKGGSIDLSANDGTLKLVSGSKVEGNWIGFTADSMELQGSIKSTATTANGGVTFHTASDYTNIKLGGADTADSGSGGLVLNNTELRNITAYNIYVQGNYGDSITLDNLDLTGGKLTGALNVESSMAGIQLTNTIKLPSATLNLNASSNTVNSNAAISAKSLIVNANRLVLDAANTINVGTGNVEVSSGSAVSLGGSGTGSGTDLSNAALQNITAGKLAINSNDQITVIGAVITPNLSYDLESGTAVTIAQAFTVKNIQLTSDTINIVNPLTAALASIRPYTSDFEIAVGYGSSCTGASCLNLGTLGDLHATTVGIGSLAGDFDGSIKISGDLGLNGATTTLGLLAPQGGIIAGAAISVQNLGIVTKGDAIFDGAINHVDKLAVDSGGHLLFSNDKSLAITELKDSASGGALYDIKGITAINNVTLDVAGSLTTDSGTTITADKLSLRAGGAIGASGNSLKTKVNELAAESTATTGSSSINITNNSASYSHALTINNVTIGSGNGGSITIDNYGATTIAQPATVSTGSGNISITAHSPLTVLGQVISGSGSIALEAGSTGSVNDDLTIGSSAIVRSAAGDITLVAGDEVIKQTGSTIEALAGKITTTDKKNTTVTNPPPVDPPPVTPPPVEPPPVTPPPVEPPPVEPPPVTPPPVEPPPVTPPPVEPPPVTPPPVEPPPVVTPPTVDICQISPSAALCQVLSPPTASEPVKPVQQAANAVINTVNKGEGSHSSGGGNSAPSDTKDDKKKDEKSEQVAVKDGQKNEEHVPKSYCN